MGDSKWRKAAIEALEANGWILECESPLELRHTDGSFASGRAAQCILDNYQDLID